MTKTMELLAKLRCVPKSAWLKINKDERYLIGEVVHEAAGALEHLDADAAGLQAELSDVRHLLECNITQRKQFAAEIERLRSEFKNFHRLLCARFGYGHDEHDWHRDQLSLIEWIAKRAAVEPRADQCNCGCYSGGCDRPDGCRCDSTCPCGSASGGPAQKSSARPCAGCKAVQLPSGIIEHENKCPVFWAMPTKEAQKSGEGLPACECLVRDKALSAYHNVNCPRYVAGQL